MKIWRLVVVNILTERREMWFSRLFLCLEILQLSTVSGNSGVEPPVTSVTQGHLAGRWFVTRGGRTVAGFLGVPYAKPPLGAFRFKSPEPPSRWEGVLSATEDKPGCPQKKNLQKIPVRANIVDEDCLYINVFTPDVKACPKLSVMVYMHGGSFEFGTSSSAAFGPEYLLDEDIILVVFNSRLGILGFLSLEHPVLPGNLGLKDQRAALRWVKDNIAQFGGDPEKITIFGESTGAASVHYHLIFTAHEGLFRAGIADSGSARSPHVFQRPGTQRALVEKLINVTNCPSDPVRLVECLRHRSVSELLEIQGALKKTSSEIKQRTPLFRPVIEPDCVEDALITTDPWNTTIDFPLLQGANEIDGLLFTVDFEKDKTDMKFQMLNDNYRNILPFNLFFDDTSENPEEIANTLKTFYFEHKMIDREHYLDLAKMVSDDRINYGLVATTRANRGKTYFYQMNYKGSNTLVRYLGSLAYYGVSHADELFFLFPLCGAGERNITESDTVVSKQIVKMWTNFAKYLDPTPVGCPVQWTPVSSSSIEYLNIGQHKISMEKAFLKRRMEFWSNLPFRNKIEKGRPQCRWDQVCTG
uniref:Carboxylic ester hydrolase n=2 Tax=Graphocephala atropunctata TaxID=36148 RepID=A0A1B6LW49_9HEMI